MNKHPTPLAIKAAIYKQLCLMATQKNMLSSDVLIAMEAIEIGMKNANEDHDALMKAMNNDQ